jgi:hypothetical protein
MQRVSLWRLLTTVAVIIIIIIIVSFVRNDSIFIFFAPFLLLPTMG